MKEVIFLTGSTGFLGAYLLRQLLCGHNNEIKQIIAFSRGKTQKEAERRVHQALWGLLPVRQRRGIISLLKVVRGDITKDNLGLSKNVYNQLTKKVTIIYHGAALCVFKMPLPIIRKVNVDGTRNVLDFAVLCQKRGKLKSVHHISTVAIGGNKQGILYENDLSLGQKFNNTYEQTKFEAEKLVRRYRKKGLPVSIYRPAIITGDTATGHTSNFRVFYQPLHLFFHELFKEIPGDKNTRYSLCPVDSTAAAIIRISLHKNSLRKDTYHITNPHEVTFGLFLGTASRYFRFRKPKIVSKKSFSSKTITPLQMRLIQTYIPYFNYKLRFDSTNAQEILSKTSFKWPVIDKPFLEKQFKFCVQSGFLGKKRKK
ncbi:MAG: SDR family oxidoreductase [Candidatus Omnitrophota bacterium]